MEHNLIENQLVILTKQTFDAFLKEENPAELIALYSFYYYTAKWQGTNQPKCTTEYVANGLRWSHAKVRKVKKQLADFGVIEDVSIKDECGRITGHYIKMNYIFKSATLTENHTVGKPQYGNDHTVVNREANALSVNNTNALSVNSKNALRDNNKKSVVVYSENENLNNAILDFIEYRKGIKSPMTDKAIKLLVNKLNGLSSDINEQIEILNQSIVNGWKGVFPIKSETQSGKKDERRYCNTYEKEIELPY